MAAAHAPTQLVQLGQAELVGTLDQNGVGARHVDAGFDDGRTHQHVEAPMIKVGHHAFQATLWQLAVGHRHSRFRHQLANLFGGVFDGLDFVVQEVDLAAAQNFPQQGLLDHAVVALLDEGFDR